MKKYLGIIILALSMVAGFVFAESDPIIVSVTPTTIYYSDELDIIGSGFGDIGGIVFLAPPDDSSQGQVVISWTDTKIRVRVNNAHLGDIRLIVGAWNETGSKGYSDPSPIITIAGSCIADIWSPGEWSECGPDGFRTISYVKTFDCDVVDTPMPDSPPSPPQACTYVPPQPTCTEDTWSCGEWSSCSLSGTQNRSCTKIFDCPSVYTPSPSMFQYCTPPSPPQPTCTADTWICGNWNSCSASGIQNRTCTKTFDCLTVITPSPPTSQNCTPPCNADTWTCGGWGSCSPSGTQTRSCRKTFDCPSVETAVPETIQYCTPPNLDKYQVSPADQQVVNQGNIIKATVNLWCPLNKTWYKVGSGTIIDSKGTILTNKHVVSNTGGCLVGFVDSYKDEPYFGDRHIADISRVSTDADIATLKLRNPYNRTLTYIDISSGNSDALRLGDKISTYGYPTKFGSKITSTRGEFSGVEEDFLKTTAIIDRGNSGGGAYLQNGSFIGIPTKVFVGSFNVLGGILSVNKVKSWLSNTPITYDDGLYNKYSRVSSILENVDLQKLDSFKLYLGGDIPEESNETEIKDGNNQAQGESVVVEADDSNQEISSDQNSVPSEKEQRPKTSWFKRFIQSFERFIQWIINLFKY